MTWILLLFAESLQAPHEEMGPENLYQLTAYIEKPSFSEKNFVREFVECLGETHI